jgi:uncharacterized membrane protein YbhN (UPF0104 family)
MGSFSLAWQVWPAWRHYVSRSRTEILHRWRIVRGIAALARDTRSLFLHPGYASLLLVTAVAGQVALAAAVLILASGLGLGVRFIDCLVVMPAVVLVSSLPISVAGWGVRELAMVTAFGMLSVPPDSALAFVRRFGANRNCSITSWRRHLVRTSQKKMFV